MLRNMPQFAPHLRHIPVQRVLVAETAIMIEGEPAAYLRQFASREIVKDAARQHLNQKDASRVEDVAQQTPLERQLFAFVDIAKHTQRIDGALEFGGSGAAERVRADLLAPLLQSLESHLGGRALLFG